MRNILIYRYIDINNSTDYKNMYKKFDTEHNGLCPNFGNKLWYQGIISEISTPDNNLVYYKKDMPVEQINETFDLVIYPMANIFSYEYSSALPDICNFIEQLKIPMYIISCGAQAKNYDELNQLVDAIGNISKRFISAVYNTGGQFALRGYFTAEFFSKLGFNNPAVVGCPSLFQLGRNLKIEKQPVSRESFKLAVNGKVEYVKSAIMQYNTTFFDQDLYYNHLYNPHFYNSKKSTLNNAAKLYISTPHSEIRMLLAKDNIRLIADMWDWRDCLKDGFHFSYGSRIHGNIIALLAGVPSVVIGFDSRTREMAEFYDIPCITSDKYSNDEIEKLDAFDLYEKTDYSIFNSKFAEKYDRFNDFLVESNIVDKINDNNPYFLRGQNDYPKTTDAVIKEAKAYAEFAYKHPTLLKLYSPIYKASKKIIK